MFVFDAFFVLGFCCSWTRLCMGSGVGTWPSELNPTGQTFYGDGATYVNGYLDPPSYNRLQERSVSNVIGLGHSLRSIRAPT